MKITDNTDEVMEAVEQALRRGLERCGQKAEGYAKMKCPKDTGLLQNSITHVVDGYALDYNYHAENGSKTGEYHFEAPKRENPTVTIGTNVEYAPYVEQGHIQAGSGNFVAPKRFLEQAVTGHTADYKSILESELKKL